MSDVLSFSRSGAETPAIAALSPAEAPTIWEVRAEVDRALQRLWPIVMDAYNTLHSVPQPGLGRAALGPDWNQPVRSTVPAAEPNVASLADARASRDNGAVNPLLQATTPQAAGQPLTHLEAARANVAEIFAEAA